MRLTNPHTESSRSNAQDSCRLASYRPTASTGRPRTESRRVDCAEQQTADSPWRNGQSPRSMTTPQKELFTPRTPVESISPPSFVNPMFMLTFVRIDHVRPEH